MLVGGRFEIEREVGAGGMGVVHRARDLETGAPVALKLLRQDTVDAVRRFAQEASLLSSLAHPGIVRHVAHGVSEDGRLWLAMEWLEGEDLAKRLERGRLAPVEAVGLLRATADALRDAHRAGLVHRDLKPGNLFLVGGDPAGVKVLDFGIARAVEDGRTLTASGTVLGTPSYMSPEQARGERRVDARADVFSLGCVLFECLTGERAFAGPHPMAVLAKILFADAPRVDEVRSGIPPALASLVSRMLARNPAERPPDGGALGDELDAIGPLPSALGSAPPRPALSAAEQRRVTVVITWARPGPTDRRGGLPFPEAERLRREIDSIASSIGARVELLADGAAVAVFVGLASATDLTARAARCALKMRARFPDAPIYVATGGAVVGDRGLVGDVIDRAVVAVRALAGTPGGPVHVDRSVAALLDARFEVGEVGGAPVLLGERIEAAAPSSRPVAGRRTSCVGRERELATLLATYDECATEPVARAVLVTGPPGIGKSRLKEELCARLEQRDRPPRIWAARGDPMTAGSALAMAAQLVRAASGAREAESSAAQHERVWAHAAARLGPAEGARAAEFLCQIADLTISAPSVTLRAARSDRDLMRDQMARAFEDLVRAECARGPLAVVLDDLQWGDPGTVQLIDTALRRLGDRPLLVVALARPEVDAAFPGLWAHRALQELPLPPLSPRSCERLAREILGERASDPTLSAIVARAGGHPFVVEELARAAAAGAGDDLPDSVLAVLQARLEALRPETRRLLRAASIFGERFWTGAVAELLGDVGAVAGSLAELVERELVELRRADETRFPGETELVFRHALVRDAVLATLTDDDLTVGHRLAAGWLERAGETDAIVLARHLEAAGELERAAGAHARAAEQTVGHDLRTAERHAARALELGLSGPASLGALLTLAETKRWLADLPGSHEAALRAASIAERGSGEWFHAFRLLLRGLAMSGEVESLRAWIGDAVAVEPLDREAAAQALATTGRYLLLTGHFDLGPSLVRRAESIAGGLDNPLIEAEVEKARGIEARYGGEPDRARELLAAAARAFAGIGHARLAGITRVHAALAAVDLGLPAVAAAELEQCMRDDHESMMASGIDGILAEVLRRAGRLDEATRMVDRSIATDPNLAALPFATRAFIAFERGDMATAREVLARKPGLVVWEWDLHLRVARARLRLAEGAPAEALAIADVTSGPAPITTAAVGLHVVRLEALAALGRRDEACFGLSALRTLLLERAARLPTDQARRAFLENVEENARALALAREWGVGP